VNREWEELEEKIKNCRKCELWKSRNNPVVGEGTITTRLMFIGEAPGYWEDMKCRPFVGRAGEMLDELLDALNLGREEIYITNVLKCRPPNNRDPLPTEIDACIPYLDRQIELINPRVVVTLGRFALSYASKKFGIEAKKIGEVHGKIFRAETVFGTLFVIPFYHPASAVYNPRLKNTLLQDVLAIKECLK
jgi:DNA polymerase